jgi:Fe-S cluster assembly ATP-binding protein
VGAPNSDAPNSNAPNLDRASEKDRSQPLLDIQDLWVSRGGEEILRGVNLAVGPGEIHVLLGLNGSGKSSLAYTLMGCAGYRPTRGRILFDGQDITHKTVAERAQLGITLAWQEPARFEGLPAGDYLALGMQDPSPERVAAALRAVALAPSAYLRRPVDQTLSGGERKRIELAAVYGMQPRLAVLDEPDSGIDVLGLEEIGVLIERMVDAGTAVLLITHREEIPPADTVSLICNGTILRSGKFRDVQAYFAHRCRPHGDAMGAQPWEPTINDIFDYMMTQEKVDE